MRELSRCRGWGLGVYVACLVLGAGAAVILVAAAADLAERGSGTETLAQHYFAALEAKDLQAALDAIDPEFRKQATPFVESNLGNTYRVTGVAVRHTSVVARLGGAPAGPVEVTVFLDITQRENGFQWQAGPRVPVVQRDGRLYLARPPLEPAEDYDQRA
ncbi:MAG: hypothetical protein GEU73_15905 [Chloroflexi bacterium]|nr:hypothetical protein [Chloroflexota bacterium]